MRIVMRIIQEIPPDKWQELEALERRFNAAEKRLGFNTNKRRYRCLSGPHGGDTQIIEHEWESFAAMEEASEKIGADPEYQRLSRESETIRESEHIEFYTPLPITT